MIKPKELPNYRPKGNVLIEFTQDEKSGKPRKGVQKWATPETAELLKEKGVAKILKEFSSDELDKLVKESNAKAPDAVKTLTTKKSK